MSHDTLAKLHTRTADAHAGFVTMTEKAEPEFRPVAQRFHDLHHAQMHRLDGMLRAVGEAPGDDGSFMGSVNEAVVSVRSWFDEIDADTMAQVRDGEKNVTEAFDNAIADPMNAAMVPDLQSMKADLHRLLEETARLG